MAESRAVPSLGWQGGLGPGATIALALLGAGSLGCSGSQEDARGQRSSTDPQIPVPWDRDSVAASCLKPGEGCGIGLVGWGVLLAEAEPLSVLLGCRGWALWQRAGLG